MAFKKPASMEECVYFTNRTIDSGRAMAWVFRKECPKCKKGVMDKPLKPTKIKDFRGAKNPADFLAKGGKFDKKADYYICNSCGCQESNEQVESSLIINIEYKCPHCGNEGETTTEYRRKSFEGVPAYIFECQKCKKKIGLTKKLKTTKKKEEDVGKDND